MIFALRHILFISILSILLSGCGTPFQGIRFRVQSPPMEEAFRKISLAISVDGYEIASLAQSTFALETKWREAQPPELSGNDRTLRALHVECKLVLRMEARGKLFDVFCTPSVRHTMQDGTVSESVADSRHPLREKWEGVFRRLLEREQKEED
jgi:hypothetical protein